MKKDFIEAFVWMYGCTKKQAEIEYNISSENYRIEVIKCYKRQCKLAFHND